MNLPILQLPQPWAWATVAGLRQNHGVDSANSSVRGPAAVVSTISEFGQSLACKFLRENGVAVPMRRDMPQGAFLGLVEISGSVRRSQAPDSLFLDEFLHHLVLVNPYRFPVPERRPYFRYKEGMPIEDALRNLRRCRDEVGRGYVAKLRGILANKGSGIL